MHADLGSALLLSGVACYLGEHLYKAGKKCDGAMLVLVGSVQLLITVLRIAFPR